MIHTIRNNNNLGGLEVSCKIINDKMVHDDDCRCDFEYEQYREAQEAITEQSYNEYFDIDRQSGSYDD